MTAKSTKGLKVCITKGSSVAAKLTPTAITKANPAVMTVSSATGVAVGDIVVPRTTGFSELDGKMFIVTAISTDDLTLGGADLTGSTGSLAAIPSVDHYDEGEMECLCLATLVPNTTEPGTVAVGTYCDPTASLPSAATEAGTITFSGYVNTADADYIELLKAAEDGVQRFLRVTLPSNGYIVAPVTFSSINWDLPLEGAVGYSGTAVLGSKLRHLF